MSRPRTLPQEGIRRTITFRPDLDESLAVLAARRRVPISTIVEELVERGLRPEQTSEATKAVDFPTDWDGADLRTRLIALRMRQKDLAGLLETHFNNLNRWIRGATPYPTGVLDQIKNALKEWDPGKQEKFRIGSRSPVA
jgi:hypothetical protein